MGFGGDLLGGDIGLGITWFRRGVLYNPGITQESPKNHPDFSRLVLLLVSTLLAVEDDWIGVFEGSVLRVVWC